MGDFSAEQKQFMSNLFQQLNTTINQKTSEIREEVKEQLEKIKEEIFSVNNNLEVKIDKLEYSNKNLHADSRSLQRKVRKNNIVLFGISSEHENLLNYVLQLFKNRLEVSIEVNDINDVYRRGRGTTQKESTPVVVEFLSYQKKLQILQNVRKLKGTNIAIVKDLCWEDRQENKILLQFQRKYRALTAATYIRGGKLSINNKLYTIEQLQNQEVDIDITEVNKRHTTAGQKRQIELTEPVQEESLQKKTKQIGKDSDETEHLTKIITRSRLKN